MRNALLGQARKISRTGLVLSLLLAVAACAPVVTPAGPAIETPHMTAHALVMADGARLPLRDWLPPDAKKPKAVILALHGFNDYSKAFEKPAEYWAKKYGIATYAYDQRGFGAAPDRGLWAGTKTLADDAVTAAALVRARWPAVPFFVAGSSMGGAVAMVAAGDDGLKAKGLILLAPALRGRAYIGAIPRATLWLLARVIPWYPLTGQGLHIQASDNIRMLRSLGRDPMVIKETRIDTVKGLVDLMDAALAAAPRLRLPTLLAYGARDELVPPAPTLDTIRRLPKGPGQIHTTAVYPNGWHMLLRDHDATTVRDDVAAWIAHPGAPLPSGADKAAAAALKRAEAAEE